MNSLICEVIDQWTEFKYLIPHLNGWSDLTSINKPKKDVNPLFEEEM